MVWNWSNRRSWSEKNQRHLWRRLQMQIWPWVRFQLWVPMEWANHPERAQIFPRFAKRIKARDQRTTHYGYRSATIMSSIHIGLSLSFIVTPSPSRAIFHFLGTPWFDLDEGSRIGIKLVWTGTACGSLPKHVSEYY